MSTRNSGLNPTVAKNEGEPISGTPTERFFAFCRERHSIYLRRRAGRPWPWTDDPVLRSYRFTNVYRELDRTTVWFREHVREQMRADPVVLLATVYFRWFNRIETGEVLFGQPDFDRRTPWDHYLQSGDMEPTQAALRSAYPAGPYFTGAYIINSPRGIDKLTGVCHRLRVFWSAAERYDSTSPCWRDLAMYAAYTPGAVSLERMTAWLAQHVGLGSFTAYEIATDLRHTTLLDRAPDMATWANIGPGARRGLNRVLGRCSEQASKNMRHRWGLSIPKAEALVVMRVLLAQSRDPAYWPPPSPDWPGWEMREVEHSLCEFDKYERTRLGEGTPRQRYRPGGPS